MIYAGIFDSIGGFISHISLNAIFGLVLILIGFITSKFLVPLLKTALARSVAEHILIIADDVTDYYAAKYPTSNWAQWIDQAVDKVIEVMGVSREVAQRAVTAAIQRKAK